MSFTKLLPFALFVGFQAVVIQIFDQILAPTMPPLGNHGFGWIAFTAWAMYFLAGCTVKDGVRTFMGYGIGILSSIGIFLLAGTLGGLGFGFLSIPVALGVVVVIMVSLEIAPALINFVPSTFIGAGVFFGFMSYVEGATFSSAAYTQLIYCLLGLCFGYTSISFRVWYENSLKRADSGSSVSKEGA